MADVPSEHERYCAEIDGAVERVHMALCEAGVRARLVRASASCARGGHLKVRVSASGRETAKKAASLVMPAEMFARCKFSPADSHAVAVR